TQERRWDRLPAYAVIPIAPDNVAAVDPVRLPMLLVDDVRSRRGQIVQLDIAGFVDDSSAGSIPSRIEVLGDLPLAISHHPLASVFLRVDEEALPSLPHDRRAIMRIALAIHALAKADLAQQLDRTRFERARANSMQHMLSALPFQYHAIDAASIEDMR